MQEEAGIQEARMVGGQREKDEDWTTNVTDHSTLPTPTP